MTAILVRDVSPRDGLQDVSEFIATDRKRELVEHIYAAGVRWIELTSFVSARAVPQLADSAALCAAVNSAGLEDLRRSVFAATQGGVERALAAGVDEISTTVPATDAMTQANFRRDQATMLNEVIHMRQDVGAKADMSVTVAVAFACPFEGVVPVDRVLSLIEQLAEGGYRTILLGDTIGYGGPRAVSELVSQVSRRLPEIVLGAHFHDARGAGVANVVAAVEAGATMVDAALGGLGGCPFAPGAAGNVATEDIVWVLSEAGFETGLDPASVATAARWLAEEMHIKTVGRAGAANWFDWENNDRDRS